MIGRWALAVLVVGGIAFAAQRPASVERWDHFLPVEETESESTAYQSSRVCRACHPSEYDSWSPVRPFGKVPSSTPASHSHLGPRTPGSPYWSLRSSTPSETRGNAVTAREILDAGYARIERELAGQPEVQSRLIGTMGGAAYESLGLYDASEGLLRKSLDLRRKMSGVDSMAVAESLQNVGHVLVLHGDFDGAEPMLSEALALRERYGTDADAAALAETLGALGVLASSRGEYAKAEGINRRRLHTARRAPPGHEAEISDALNDLSMSIQQSRRDYAAAKTLAEEALALRRRIYPAPHLAISQGLNNLAKVLYRLKGFDAAEPLFGESLAMNRQLLGELHPEVAANLSNLGVLARDRGEYRQADELFVQVIDQDRRILGADHVQVGRSLNDWGESVVIHKKALGATHWQTASTEALLARCLVGQSRFAEAERPLLAAYSVLDKEFRPLRCPRDDCG